jgi:NAD-reducing hydrogenase large subunit
MDANRCWKELSEGSAEGGNDMAQRIVIDPVSRIEGHAKISIFVDETGRVTDARFHVTEFRGFERFCQGRRSTRCPA